MIKGWLTFFLTAAVTIAGAQKYITHASTVTFFSDAAIEDITAENKKSTSLFNAETGEIAFSIPIKEFLFAKSLMREHFNERYMNSEKYPRSTFQGTLSGFDAKSTQIQNVRAKGQLTIHGETKTIDVPGTVKMENGKLMMKSKFIVTLADYKIEIPQLVWQNIAEQVEVSVDFSYKTK